MLASRFGERATLKREQDWVVTYRSAGAEEGWNAISIDMSLRWSETLLTTLVHKGNNVLHSSGAECRY